ncbi:peptidase [candidate division KSB3 bacterium]|uniref:Peptidase n=1 Tax=candidate division KSB3 bacterium TaxID=2044937 RepID=A0A2G6E6N8_9BACT|nr:MAG: peptidase [candidate division KSB3 bacterium]PIE30025.1 MAG: peptidase [candidate division KSB3 bacterium]
MKKNIAPYGSWKSPITSEAIAAESIRLAQPSLNGDDVYWLEMRPAEGGRNVLVRRRPDGQTQDVTPPPYSVRTRVHEYGGGAYLIRNGDIYFSNFSDQRIYHHTYDSVPQAITPENSTCRYADYNLDHTRRRLIAVREEHHKNDREATNTIVCLDLDATSSGTILTEGADFYSDPRISPDGRQLLWLCWNHPNMPWDGTELWLADILEDGLLGQPRKLAGGPEESILQPQWSPDGVIYFISDRTGWWNLYRWENQNAEILLDIDAEFASPHWVFGASTYDFISETELLCSYNAQGNWHVLRFDVVKRRFKPLDLPWCSIESLQTTQQQAVLCAGSAVEPLSIITVSLDDSGTDVLRRSTSIAVDKTYLSQPEALEFPTENGQNAFAFYYPPCNRDYQAPEDERPPLLVMSHGGPTSSTSTTLKWSLQYWTSRGFAVLDVNYGGSTGYGRAYRERLKGQWGIVDIQDCINGARFLVKAGHVDGRRLAIRGGSAGGYTTLGALAFHNVFQAGASYYGVSDIEALAKETHKFESRYFDSLIGPYPEQQARYQQRSPIHYTGQFSCPVIFFQGLEDKVVPPNQAENMFRALKEKGIPTAYVAYAGEQHGFRQAENIKHALDTELYFYSRIFGFEPAELLEGITIENL